MKRRVKIGFLVIGLMVLMGIASISYSGTNTGTGDKNGVFHKLVVVNAREAVEEYIVRWNAMWEVTEDTSNIDMEAMKEFTQLCNQQNINNADVVFK